MLRASITLMTLLELNEDLFENLELPSRPFTDRGYEDLYLEGWDLDKDTLINNLLMETAELNVLYTDPVFMAWAIAQWSKKELPVWQAMYETLFFKYNPIWNKDGKITHEGSRSLAPGVQETEQKTYNLQDQTSGSVTNSGTVTTETDRDDSNTQTINTGETLVNSGTLTKVTDQDTSDLETTQSSEATLSTLDIDDTTDVSVSAYDTATLQPRDRTVTDRVEDTNTNVTGSGTKSNTGSNDITETTTDETSRQTTNSGTVSNTGGMEQTEVVTDATATQSSGTAAKTGTETTVRSRTGSDLDSDEYSDLEQGNIGVTSSQALITQERELAKFSIYDYIIESFKCRFCILVY